MRSKRLRVAVSAAAACVMAMLAAQSAQAQTYKVLYSFGSDGSGDGGRPYAGVIQGTEGSFYGTNAVSGDPSCLQDGCGTVFKLSKAGKETVLHDFTGTPDGALPLAGVIQDADGSLYGTTGNGGNKSCYFGYGCGTVFRVSKTGKETVLYRFTGGADGAYPQAGVILDAKGNLYGTTSEGGDTTCQSGCGVVFRLSKAGKETVLYSFKGGVDGASPLSGVIQDANGNLYGTTLGGGTSGNGTVFKLSKTGKETVLHSFTGGTGGGLPSAGVTQDANGNLYGTTESGGDLSCDEAGQGCGVVFKVSKTGNQTVLYSFAGASDGAFPYAGVIKDVKGNLYGTTFSGGDLSCGGAGSGCGVVFKLSKTGKETVLHSFCSVNCPGDGTFPFAGLIQDAKGNLYGTTTSGGVHGSGTVFKLTP